MHRAVKRLDTVRDAEKKEWVDIGRPLSQPSGCQLPFRGAKKKGGWEIYYEILRKLLAKWWKVVYSGITKMQSV